MNLGFWGNFGKKPIFGLSPMDGVTDAPTRKLIAEVSNPDLIITEFVNVEGLARGAIKMLDDFLYHEIERPVVAQIYGIEEESFYKVALIACELGFDGIDINMGCPAKKVSARGAGAGLIQTPDQAKKIICFVKKAAEDFSNGITLKEAGIRPKIILAVDKMKKKYPWMQQEKSLLPVSVKTRMGYDEVIIEHWIEHLLSQNLSAITLHGRTLKQGYGGEANWEVIKKAAEIVKKSGLPTKFLGNGDILNLEDAKQKIITAGVDGVLVGRATFGNPWFFNGHIPTEEERKNMAIKHCEYFEEIFPERRFFIMRKHLGWYAKGFDGAREMRAKLMKAENSQEVKEIFEL